MTLTVKIVLLFLLFEHLNVTFWNDSRYESQPRSASSLSIGEHPMSNNILNNVDRAFRRSPRTSTCSRVIDALSKYRHRGMSDVITIHTQATWPVHTVKLEPLALKSAAVTRIEIGLLARQIYDWWKPRGGEERWWHTNSQASACHAPYGRFNPLDTGFVHYLDSFQPATASCSFEKNKRFSLPVSLTYAVSHSRPS